ncbi:MAG: TetR/AcrR family transcriptional regulator, partial [Brachybacterium tyrofermentans]
MSVDPLSQALRTLDSISAAELEVGADLRTVVGAPAELSAVAPSATTGDAGPDLTMVLQEPGVAEVPLSTTPGQARREAILDGAAALFAERGYHGASLRDISRRVGISHPG